MESFVPEADYYIAKGFIPLNVEEGNLGWLRVGKRFAAEEFHNVDLQVRTAEVVAPDDVEDPSIWDLPNNPYKIGRKESPVAFAGKIILANGKALRASGMHFRSGERTGIVALEMQ